MHIMLSYTREDRDRVERVVDGLRRLGHEPWYDRSLHSGENWWNVILQSIATSDAVLLAISPSFLVSHACTAERQFAVAMRRPLLAVMVAPVGHSVLPVELAGLHILDYTQPSEATAFELVRSIDALPPAPPPPNPLPPAPPVPLSYLNSMRDRISGPPLDVNSQMSIIAQLADGLRSGDADESNGARELGFFAGSQTDTGGGSAPPPICAPDNNGVRILFDPVTEVAVRNGNGQFILC